MTENNSTDDITIKKQNKNKILLSVCVNAFLVLSLLFFAPLEIYLGNIAEFNFSFFQTWFMLLAASLIIIIFLVLIESILPKILFKLANLTAFALGLCCYIQAMFLNGKMSSLTGETYSFEQNLIVRNLALWIAIFAIIYIAYFILSKFKKKTIVLNSIQYVSLALVLMQIVAFISLVATTDTSNFIKMDYLTTEGKYELSDKNNVVVFIVDTCDGVHFQSALNKYPDMLDNFPGFTYFPNATSTHSRTYPSIPYLLTGQMCYFDVPSNQYINSAYEHSSFLPDIYDSGCDIRLFTDDQYVGDSVKPYIKNSAQFKQHSLSSISISGLLKNMLKISLYRELPYAFKPYMFYEIGAVNSAVMNVADKNYAVDDANFYANLTSQQLTVGNYDSAFRFYHFWGAHPGYSIDNRAQTVGYENTNAEDAIRGDLYIIEEYIRQMQELGIYKNSTIIITADHGSSGGGDTLEIKSTACPLMMVKPAGKDKDAVCSVSNAPVCHEDLFQTVNDTYGISSEKYGSNIFAIEENASRERYYYYTSLYSDIDGEIALREYSVNGDARNFNNWVLTGRNWDVNYSENTVSDKRLTDSDAQ